MQGTGGNMKIKRKRTTNLKSQSWITIKLTIPTALILSAGILLALKFTQISEVNIKNTISVLDKSIQTESDMVSAFIQYAGNTRSGDLRLATGRIQEHHDLNIAAIRESIPLIQKTVSDMFFIVYILIAAMVLQFIYLVFAIFRITNRIYGPAKVMEKILNDASKGKKPVKANLRKNDQLKPLFAEIYRAAEIIVPVVQRRIKREEKKL